MEGVWKRFTIQKHKYRDGMILSNRLATSKNKKKGGYAELNNNIWTNALRRQYKAVKRHRGGGGYKTAKKVCLQFYNSGVYTYMKKNIGATRSE